MWGSRDGQTDMTGMNAPRTHWIDPHARFLTFLHTYMRVYPNFSLTWRTSRHAITHVICADMNFACAYWVYIRRWVGAEGSPSGMLSAVIDVRAVITDTKVRVLCTCRMGGTYASQNLRYMYCALAACVTYASQHLIFVARIHWYTQLIVLCVSKASRAYICTCFSICIRLPQSFVELLLHFELDICFFICAFQFGYDCRNLL